MLITDIYDQKKDPAEIKFLVNRGVQLSSRLKSVEDAAAFVKRYAKQMKEVVGLMEAFFIILRNHNQFLAEKTHRIHWEQFLEICGIKGGLREEIEHHSGDIVERFEDRSFKLNISTGSSLHLILLDFILRWISLGLLKTHQLDELNELTMGFDNVVGFFFVIQIFVIPAIIIVLGLLRNKHIVERLQKLTREIGLANLKFVAKQSAWDYSLLVLFVMCGLYISQSLIPGKPTEKLVLAMLVSVFYLVYLMIFLRLFSKKIPTIDQINHQLKLNEKSGIAKELDPDENDEEIVNLEVRLRSVNEKMNAYVLEATLFGALAFSGFLQIVASEVFTIGDIKIFTAKLFTLFDGVVNFDTAYLSVFMQYMNSREGLLALICYESLFCSIFFLSVIASRLRFSRLTDVIDKALQLSRSYNLKEEDLLNNQNRDMDDIRVQKFNKQIRDVLKIGNKEQKKITPIMEYMAFFRNLGVISFFVILITAALFISVELSLIFCSILLLSFLYFKFDDILFFFRSLTLRIEEFYFSVYQYVSPIAWGVILFAAILRSLDIGFGNLLLLLGFTALSIHNLLTIFVPELDHVRHGSSNQMKDLMDKVFKVALAVFFLAWYFNVQNFPGAEGIFTLSAVAFSLFFFFYPLIPRASRGLQLLSSFTLGLSVTPFIFTFYGLESASLLTIIISPLIIVLLVQAFSRPHIFKNNARKVLIALALLYSTRFIEYNNFVFQEMRFDISSYDKFIVEQDLLTSLEKFENPESKQEFDSLLYYKSRYINSCIDHSSSFEMNREAETLVKLGQYDERFLELADEVLALSLESDKIFQNYVNRLEVLIALDKYLEAHDLAEELMEYSLLNESKIRQEEARKYLDRVNRGLTSNS